MDSAFKDEILTRLVDIADDAFDKWNKSEDEILARLGTSVTYYARLYAKLTFVWDREYIAEMSRLRREALENESPYPDK